MEKRPRHDAGRGGSTWYVLQRILSVPLSGARTGQGAPGLAPGPGRAGCPKRQTRPGPGARPGHPGHFPGGVNTQPNTPPAKLRLARSWPGLV